MAADASRRRFAGKRILVTAGASGMGRAGVELLAAQGATVCVVDRDADRLAETIAAVEQAGGKAISLTVDLLHDGETKRIVHAAADALGGSIDAAWLHAGIPSPHGIEGLDSAEVLRCMDLNVHGTIATLGELVPYLRKADDAAILLTSSISGLVGSRLSPVYSAAKFGVVGLAKSLAQSLGPDGIRVNAICPGITETPMMHDFMTNDQRANYLLSIPLRRIAQPMEIASAAAWLLSAEASYVTGVALPVDGGFVAG